MVRAILSYVTVFLVAVALTLEFAPQKVVIETKFEQKPLAAPVNVQLYMDAYCALDIDYLIQWTSPTYSTADKIIQFGVETAAAGQYCNDTKYYGAYRDGNSYIFTIIISSGREEFYILTFDGDMVVNIQ